MTACSSTIAADPNATAKAIDVTEARRLHGRAGVEFVDPRPASVIESTTGMIPGARNLTLDRMDDVLRRPGCRNLPRWGVDTLNRVMYLDGGTRAWVEAGHPTV